MNAGDDEVSLDSAWAATPEFENGNDNTDASTATFAPSDSMAGDGREVYLQRTLSPDRSRRSYSAHSPGHGLHDVAQPRARRSRHRSRSDGEERQGNIVRVTRARIRRVHDSQPDPSEGRRGTADRGPRLL